MRYGEFDLRVQVDFFVLRNDFRIVEKDSSISIGAADETVAILDGGHDTRFTFLTRHYEGLVKQFNVGSTLQFITTINGNIELNPISMSASRQERNLI